MIRLTAAPELENKSRRDHVANLVRPNEPPIIALVKKWTQSWVNWGPRIDPG
jgi:hypothetical protein